MALHSPQFTAANWPAAYVQAMPGFGLLTSNLPKHLLRLSALEMDSCICEQALSFETKIEDDLDSKTRAAYLMNRLSYELARVVAAVDLTGHQTRHFTADNIAFTTTLEQTWYNGLSLPYLKTSFVVPPCFMIEQIDCAKQVNATFLRIFAPVVRALTAIGKLSTGALWRIVGDGIAAGYLELGKAAGDPELARKRAEEILEDHNTPLWNKKLGFIEIELPADQSPTAKPIKETFRKRGGCCRYYTSRRSEGTYCPTCVHVKDHTAVLQQYLRPKTLETMENSA
ncbi:MAG: hypothetical protein COB16_08570 [Rhodobacteraceae bacterium]|nr:MAG: hypothetical protein COB16_08570 [Paracoccaceae bacterium]